MDFPPQGIGASIGEIEKLLEKERARAQKFKYLTIFFAVISVILGLIQTSRC